MNYETIIVGGGLAGLALGHQLSNVGQSILLLEANARIGGRILSQNNVDLGPTWFWDHQPRIKQLAAHLGLKTFEQYGSGDMLFEQATGQISQFHAGPGAANSWRVDGGLQRMVSALQENAEHISVKTDCAIISIVRIEGTRWQANSAGGQTFEAKNLVLAMPPRIIAKSISLPSELKGWESELRSIPTWMAAHAKFVAIYTDPFWRSSGLSGQVSSQVGPMVEIHDASDLKGGFGALFGFIGVPYQSRKNLVDGRLEQACLAQIVRLFGDEAAHPTSIHLKDWAADPQVATEAEQIAQEHPHGGLSNDLTHAFSAMNLHICGAESARSETGYLEGALLSALDVANNILGKA